MDKLLELLGEEKFTSLKALLGDVKVIVDDGNFIPKSRFDEVNQTKNSLKEQIETMNGELTKLKKLSKDNEEATSKIEALQNDIKAKEKDAALLSKKFAIKDALREAGATHADLLADKFELDKIELDGDKIKDVENVLKPVREKYSDMFGTAKLGGDSPKDGKTPIPNEYKVNPWKKETLNLTLQGKILKEKPELAAKLRAEAGIK